MNVPLRWLQEFIDLPTTDPDELSGVLAMLGHEVEGYEVMEADWTRVIVGEVVEIGPHPDADKVRVCQVDTGSGPEQIICGAWNFTEGARVAVALPGALLPGGFEIGVREIRGVESNGMITSERELKLGDDHAGIMVLEDRPEIGTDFKEVVELPDIVFDLTITPNRPDAMSLVGIARDLGAHFGVPHRIPERPLVTVPGSTDFEVTVEDTIGCRRFTAREIRGVSMRPSPLWVRHRLAKAGMRSISNVVDVTNYVMLELGHPLHAFDASSISGRHLIVRRAASGETLKTLDGVVRQLGGDDLIIYDDQGPTSMAGTMGGERSEVSENSDDILLEAAAWDPPTIMYMSRRHGLRSEASTRFERGVDPNLSDVANQRAAAMMIELAGGRVVEGSIDVLPEPIEPVEVELRLAEVRRLLGDEFTVAEVTGILTALEMAVDGEEPLQVAVPTFRPDVTRPADLVEEIARIHGYDRFDSTLPTGQAGGLTTEQRRLRRLHNALVGVGIHQAVTLPFVGSEDLAHFGWAEESKLLHVVNPLREEERTLRPSMLPGLLNAVRFNLSHGESSVSLFETAVVFLALPWEGVDHRLPTQHERLAWALTGPIGPLDMGADPRFADADVSLALARQVLQVLGHTDYRFDQVESVPGYHPGRTASLSIRGEPVGHVGELSPRAARQFDLSGPVAIAELDLQALLAGHTLTQAVLPSVFPHVDFDLSFLAPLELAAGSLVSATREAGSGLVESARVFDLFEGPGLEEGHRALAIRYRLRARDRTLAGDEIARVRQAMIDAAESLGGRLRGA
ncbi:MAG: phenylalanine--tRNA ligase subunit beta [Acidimicrobiia bacterium]